MAVIRFMKLVDSVLPLLVPRWEYSQASFTSLEVGLGRMNHEVSECVDFSVIQVSRGRVTGTSFVSVSATVKLIIPNGKCWHQSVLRRWGSAMA